MAENNTQAQEKVSSQNVNELIRVRKEKLAALQDAGKDPFKITKYNQTHHTDEVKNIYNDHEAKLLAGSSPMASISTIFPKTSGGISAAATAPITAAIMPADRKPYSAMVRKIIFPTFPALFFLTLLFSVMSSSFLVIVKLRILGNFLHELIMGSDHSSAVFKPYNLIHAWKHIQPVRY